MIRQTIRPVTVILAVLALLSACDQTVAPTRWQGQPGSTEPNAAGLVSLPCDDSEPLAPVKPDYCRSNRHFMTPDARDAVVGAARAVAARFPGTRLQFMDASGPDGVVPFAPHLSHGDGRQIDLALFYTDRNGQPMDAFAASRSYGPWWPAEPPRPGEDLACPGGRKGRAEKPDPPADRPWQLDEPRTKALIDAMLADTRVRRILIEPHLERRLGYWGHPKMRFAGCQAARHDDHLHIDFY